MGAEDRARREAPPEPGTVDMDEVKLRKVFVQLDIGGNDMVSAANLKHLFAQLGDLPTDKEIDGMIYLCDPDGEGVVTFENFLNVFHAPAEALRNISMNEMQEIVYGTKGNSDSEDSSEAKSSRGSSSSSG